MKELKEWEYIIQTRKEDIDFINKIMEVHEGVGNVRTLDNKNGLIKILSNMFFLSELEEILNGLVNYNIKIEILEKREWQGVL